jgi:uncharacterized membrane protein (UPF0136 family)
MKRNLKLIPRALFIILGALPGFFIGASAGSLVAGKDSGLAGGATVLVFGVGCCAVAAILAGFLARRLQRSRLRAVLAVLAIVDAILIGWFFYRLTVSSRSTTCVEVNARSPIAWK